MDCCFFFNVLRLVWLLNCQFDMEAKGNVNYQAIWANPGHWTEQAEKVRKMLRVILCVHMLLIV